MKKSKYNNKRFYEYTLQKTLLKVIKVWQEWHGILRFHQKMYSVH